MKKFLFLIVIFLGSVDMLLALSGREIIEKSDSLPAADTGYFKFDMRIRDNGKISGKEFILFLKKTGKTEKNKLIEFVKPAELKLLIRKHNMGDDDQWLKFSSGNVKHITQPEKSKPFANSHFFFEDLQSRDIDGYDYKYTGDKIIGGENCYAVETVKKSEAGKVYDKTIIYARKSDFFTVRIDFYRNGELLKYLENRDIKTVNGILTPHKIVMMKWDETGGTILNLQEVKYNIPLQESIFSEDSLK